MRHQRIPPIICQASWEGRIATEIKGTEAARSIFIAEDVIAMPQNDTTKIVSVTVAKPSLIATTVASLQLMLELPPCHCMCIFHGVFANVPTAILIPSKHRRYPWTGLREALIKISTMIYLGWRRNYSHFLWRRHPQSFVRQSNTNYYRQCTTVGRRGDRNYSRANPDLWTTMSI